MTVRVVGVYATPPCQILSKRSKVAQNAIWRALCPPLALCVVFQTLQGDSPCCVEIDVTGYPSCYVEMAGIQHNERG